MIASILPVEGNVLTLRIIRGIQEKLALTVDEQNAIDLKVAFADNQQRTTWNAAKEKERETADIRFEPAEFSLIHDILGKLDKQDKLTMELLPVYEQFLNVLRNA